MVSAMMAAIDRGLLITGASALMAVLVVVGLAAMVGFLTFGGGTMAFALILRLVTGAAGWLSNLLKAAR
jgi:hypothetical protein